jgi:hypothetical protein
VKATPGALAAIAALAAYAAGVFLLLLARGYRLRAPRKNAPRPPPEPVAADALGLTLRASHSGHRYYQNELPPKQHGPFVEDALFGQDVAGEFFYQRALEALVGGARDAPVYFRTVAQLWPEPDNPHDANAVAVRIGGVAVGHIKRAECAAFGRLIAERCPDGFAQCRALIAGGGRPGRDGKPTLYSVRLDIALPSDIARRAEPR